MRSIPRAIMAAAFMLTLGFQSASAQWIFVGSWQVDEGPSWTEVPPQYSGLEAAVHLFGGAIFQYAISTRGPDVADINHMAWYSTWGGNCGGDFPCGTMYDEGFKNGALYAAPGDVSAYVRDWAAGPEFTNYAFRRDDAQVVPEPLSMVLLGTGLFGVGLARRRRRLAP